jgi:hypothetical protein
MRYLTFFCFCLETNTQKHLQHDEKIMPNNIREISRFISTKLLLSDEYYFDGAGRMNDGYCQFFFPTNTPFRAIKGNAYTKPRKEVLP